MSDPFNQQSVRIRASEVSVTSYAWLLMLSCALLPPNSGLHVFRMQPTIPLDCRQWGSSRWWYDAIIGAHMTPEKWGNATWSIVPSQRKRARWAVVIAAAARGWSSPLQPRATTTTRLKCHPCLLGLTHRATLVIFHSYQFPRREIFLKLRKGSKQQNGKKDGPVPSGGGGWHPRQKILESIFSSDQIISNNKPRNLLQTLLSAVFDGLKMHNNTQILLSKYDESWLKENQRLETSSLNVTLVQNCYDPCR